MQSQSVDDKFLSRRPVEQFEECSWGVAPGNAIVVSSAMAMQERLDIQIFLEKAVERYGTTANPPPTDYSNDYDAVIKCLNLAS